MLFSLEKMWISRRALGVTRDNLLIESCAGKWTRGSRLFENVQQEARQRPGGRVGISVRCVLARRHRSHCAHGPFYKLICQLYHTAADFSSFFAHRKEISLALTGSAENNKLFSGGRHLIECCRIKNLSLAGNKWAISCKSRHLPLSDTSVPVQPDFLFF